MRQRKMRIPAVGTAVRLSGRQGALVDISLSGALIEMNGPLDLGTEALMELRKGAGALELMVRVVRLAKPRPRAQMVTGTAWPMGVTFVGNSAANLKAIPRFLGW